MNYRGDQWEPVCLTDTSDADRICQDMKCGSATRRERESLKEGENADVELKCENAHNLMHCFKSRPTSCTQKAVIYCDSKCNAKRLSTYFYILSFICYSVTLCIDNTFIIVLYSLF